MLAMAGSELALGEIEERPVLIKSLILGVTAVSYVIGAAIAVVLYSHGSSALNWLMLALLLAAVGLAALTYIVDEGWALGLTCSARRELYTLLKRRRLQTYPG
ncbi:uncharacterized protein LOC144885729 [Branchiostoma floridae x Branchiostoma japonicum]